MYIIVLLIYFIINVNLLMKKVIALLLVIAFAGLTSCGAADTMKDKANSVADTATEGVKAVADTATEGVKAVADTVVDGADAVVDTAKDGADTVVETVIEPTEEKTGEK